MLGNQNRLTKEEDFERVKQKGKIFQGDFFALSVLKRGDSKPSRFGFIVSNKISKNASIRNRVKRALREGARQSLFLAKPGYDGVFLAKPNIVKKYTTEIMDQVFRELKKAKLLKKAK